MTGNGTGVTGYCAVGLGLPGTMGLQKEILGHESIKITQRYAHLGKGHLVSKAEIVSYPTEPQPKPTNVLPLEKESDGE